MASTRTIVFVCLHGAAKSVMASVYLNRLSEQRGLDIRATAAGIAPEPGVPSRVVEALLEEGIDVRHYRPRRATREELAVAWCVVSFGCDLSEIVPEGLSPIRWDDVPLVSEGFAAARDAIMARLPSLLDSDPERRGRGAQRRLRRAAR